MKLQRIAERQPACSSDPSFRSQKLCMIGVTAARNAICSQGNMTGHFATTRAETQLDHEGACMVGATPMCILKLGTKCVPEPSLGTSQQCAAASSQQAHQQGGTQVGAQHEEHATRQLQEDSHAQRVHVKCLWQQVGVVRWRWRQRHYGNEATVVVTCLAEAGQRTFGSVQTWHVQSNAVLPRSAGRGL